MPDIIASQKICPTFFAYLKAAMQKTAPLSREDIREALSKYGSPTASNLADFEAALRRAADIYRELPAEVTLRSSRRMHPADYGGDVRTSFFGVLEEQVSYLEAIGATCGHKLFELAQGISEGLYLRRFRLAVLSTRALYEEAAAAKYYLDQITGAMDVTLSWSRLSKQSLRVDKWRVCRG